MLSSATLLNYQENTVLTSITPISSALMKNPNIFETSAKQRIPLEKTVWVSRIFTPSLFTVISIRFFKHIINYIIVFLIFYLINIESWRKKIEKQINCSCESLINYDQSLQSNILLSRSYFIKQIRTWTKSHNLK